MSIRTLLVATAFVSGASFWIACGNDSTTPSDGGADGSIEDSGPPACDPSKDPSCVNDSSGFFVSPTGDDSNAGTKASPLKTIGTAVSKTGAAKPNVYICVGTYAEHVKLTTAVNLVGGFGCADWSYAPTNKPKVAPSDEGYALDVESVSSGIAISDLEFDAQAGKDAGASSIAVFVSSSSNVSLKRVTAVASDGVDGADPTTVDVDAGTPATPPASTNESGGAGCTQTCGSVVTTGGKGGDGAPTAGSVTDGADGGPAVPPNDGHGVGGHFNIGCGPGTPGNTGLASDAGAAGASKAGTLAAMGWSSSGAVGGGSGGVGQGGGGGSGGVSASVGGGGGGGCGGCGGAGGAPGNSGGSSFAVLVYQSTVTLDTCALTAGKAGDGKAGGKGLPGQTGGFPGNPAQSGIGCTGGTGGNGGAGAGGGGGAGGNAIAVGYVGTKPTVTSSTYSEGVAGQPGAGGTGGAGNDGAQGAPGIKGDVEELN